MNDKNEYTIHLALPSKGVLEKPTLNFLRDVGLKVHRPNERQYLASIPSAPHVTVLFQRATDIFKKVAEGSADFGITGFDIVSEYGVRHDDVIVIKERLGYGGCELVLAVPDSWIDVSSIDDLADLAILFKEKGKELRIATKYPNMVRKWLYERAIVHFSLVEGQGALEVAPNMGYADLIADITSSGTTLRENRLKRLLGGTILQSEACLIGNRKLLVVDDNKLRMAKTIMELVEAHLRAKKFVSITANICGESPEAIARELNKKDHLAGLRGPSIARVHSKTWGEGDWYTVTIIVERNMLLETVNHLRKAGGIDVIVSSLDCFFDSASWEYEMFLERLRRTDSI